MSTLTGCTQQNQSLTQNDDTYKPFKKNLIINIYKSLEEHPDFDNILDICQFKGFVLAVIDIDEKGSATFELLYASSELFKEAFYEPLLQSDTSSLDNNRRYLIPISYHITRTMDINCKRDNQKKMQPFFGKFSKDIDFVFQPFDFFWITPIS